MAMFSCSVVFCLTLGILLKVCKSWSGLNTVISMLGWLVLITYTANVLTRLICSLIPRSTVDPTNKAVLITGCDSGFGHSLAQRLSKVGYLVFAGCLDKDGEGAQQLKDSCPTDNLQILSLDVSKYDAVQASVKEIESSLGDKDLWAIVNNAGVAIFSELEWCSMSIIEHMFNVNVLGAVRVTKAFLPLLRKSRGRVVVVSSVAGHVTYPGFLSYSMTKHALVSFSDGLRREMRKWGIAVSTIEPAMYRTRISRSDVLTGALDNSWEKTPEPIKEAYGFPYYKDFRHRMQKMALHARPYLEEVVDCMEKAVVDREPRITYRCSGPVDKIRHWIMAILPVPILDLVICQVIQPSHRQLSANGKSPQ